MDPMARMGAKQRTQKGQAAVLVALGLFCMVIFLALATNVGIVVNDRVRFQNAADLAAYAGAFEQARALNRMTEINRRMIMVADDIRKHLTCKDLPTDPKEIITLESDCDKNGHRVFPMLFCDQKVPDAILKVGQARLDALAALFMLENTRATQPAIRAARMTADANIHGLARPTKSNFYEWNKQSPTNRLLEPLIKVERAQTTFTWAMWRWAGHCGCPTFKPWPIPNIKGCLDVFNRDLDTWFYKDTPGPSVFFPARVNGVPQKEFLDFGEGRKSFFEGRRKPIGISDGIWAFAAAKPFGGNIGPELDQNGELQTIRFKIWIASKTVKGYDYDSFEDADTWDKFVPQYRARMMAIQEKMVVDDGAGRTPITPLEIMKYDLLRAAKAPSSKIEQYMLH
ncbi:MAG: pilus assembly protein TadG-related protein [Myxococcota bacterium]